MRKLLITATSKAKCQQLEEAKRRCDYRYTATPTATDTATDTDTDTDVDTDTIAHVKRDLANVRKKNKIYVGKSRLGFFFCVLHFVVSGAWHNNNNNNNTYLTKKKEANNKVK